MTSISTITAVQGTTVAMIHISVVCATQL